MPSASIETGPSMMEQIFLMATSGSAWPALEMRVGLVVTPPSTPQLAASSISEISAVSRDRIMSILSPFTEIDLALARLAVALTLFPGVGGVPFPGGTRLGWEAASPPQVTAGEPPRRIRPPSAAGGLGRQLGRRGSRSTVPAIVASLHVVTLLGDLHLLGTIPMTGDCLLWIRPYPGSTHLAPGATYGYEPTWAAQQRGHRLDE